MRRKTSLPRLPPLPFDVLREVQNTEEYARRALSICAERGSMSFNVEQATRLLRTCVVTVLDLQIEYYASLPSYHSEWIKELMWKTVDSAIGLFPLFVSGESLRDELEHTLKDHLKQSKLTQRVGPSKQAEALSKQLEVLRVECRLTVEDMADALDVALRSVYRHLSGEATRDIGRSRLTRNSFRRGSEEK